MQFLDNVLVIGGEDKPTCSEMHVAQSELLLKHKGANAALYGHLGYIIMIATAGECVRIFALNIRHSAQLQPLVAQFQVGSVAWFLVFFACLVSKLIRVMKFMCSISIIAYTAVSVV